MTVAVEVIFVFYSCVGAIIFIMMSCFAGAALRSTRTQVIKQTPLRLSGSIHELIRQLFMVLFFFVLFSWSPFQAVIVMTAAAAEPPVE